MTVHPKLAKTVSYLNTNQVPKERREVLQPLITYIQSKVSANVEAQLNFICTHNSRRSQFAQVWAQTAAYYYNIEVSCYSGGVEVTTFNKRAVEAIKRAGFNATKQGETDENQIYSISFSKETNPINAFSKLYNDSTNPTKSFAAVMTCSHADENCPFIPGIEKRIQIMYDDPKAFDDTPEEVIKYDERSIQIANEMFYVFSQI